MQKEFENMCINKYINTVTDEDCSGRSFSITRDEIEQLEREYLYKDCINYLLKAAGIVGVDKTISEAIDELSKKLRCEGNGY